MCKQHKDVPTPEIPCDKKILQSLGACQSWQLWNISYSYPLLVNLEYLFFNQSSSFQIWYTCCQHNSNFVSKISNINNYFPALGRVSKLAAVWALSLELHISVSPHCTWYKGFTNHGRVEAPRRKRKKSMWRENYLKVRLVTLVFVERAQTYLKHIFFVFFVIHTICFFNIYHLILNINS
jgi:hypothetical protein